jgi:phage tail sheath gpL-like
MSISILGVGPNTLPGVLDQISWATGPLSLGTAKYAVIILANIRQDGSGSAGNAGTGSGIDGYNVYGPDTPVPMQSVNDALALFGGGSPAALAVADFMAINKSTPLYVAPVKQAIGGTAATWTLTVTLSGPLTNGSISLQVGPDAPVVTTVNASIDTATSIAANIASNINATNLLPVSAVATTGTLVLTTKVVGQRQNWLIASAKIVNGTGVVISQTQPSNFVNGAGLDTVEVQNVLNTLAVNGLRYYYYVPEAGCDSVDAATFEEVQAQIDELTVAPICIRQRVVGGSSDTLANTQAVTTTVNDPRVEVVWLPSSQTVPLRLAARAASVYSLQEIPPLGAQDVNFDGFGNDSASFQLWNVPAPLNGSAPSVLSQQSATITGITPLAVQNGGRTSIVKRATSRFYTNGSGTFDGRITDGGKVTIADQFTDDVKSLIVATFPRCLIGADPAQGSPPAIPGVCTPGLVKNLVQTVINNYASRGLINGPSTSANLQVEVDALVPTRIDIQVGLFTANPLHTVILSVLQNQ